MKCYFCEKESVKHSKEHLIPESLGGKLKSYKLLCSKCNSQFGKTIDAEIYKQLGMFSDLLGLNNDDPKVSLLDKEGEYKEVSVMLQPRDKLTIQVAEDKLITKFVKPDGKTLQKKVDEILKGKRTYKVNWLQTLEEPTDKLYYLTNYKDRKSPNLTMGGKLYFQHYLKTSINFYLHWGFQEDYIKNAINILKNDLGRVSYFYYPSHYQPYELTDQEISHVVCIDANPETGFAICYIEYFNCECILTILSNNYNGERRKEIYIQNLLNNDLSSLNKDVELRLTKNHLEDISLISENRIFEVNHDLKYKNLWERLKPRFRHFGTIE